MNILRIIYDWPPPWGGLSPHPYEVTLAQKKLNHEIEIFCGRWPKAGKLEEIEGVKFHPILREPFPATISFTSSVILFFKYLGWRKKHKPDVIHSHGHFAIWIYLYRLFLMKYFPWSEELSIPLVAHFHNTAKGRWVAMDEAGKYISPHSKYIQWPLQVLSDKWAIKVASACIFVSHETLEEAKKHYDADLKRCFVVESGVNTDMFVPAGGEETEKSRRELNYDIYDKVILYHGMVLERKNVHILVDVIKNLPDVYKLLIVGQTDPIYEQKIRQAILHANLEDRITMIGYTPYPQVPIAYQIADLFILPSSWEGLPKVVMQGLSCGVPCLVSGFKLEEEISGLTYLENLDPGAMAIRIQDIIANPPKVDTDKIRQKYSWDYKVNEIEQVYAFVKKYTKK